VQANHDMELPLSTQQLMPPGKKATKKKRSRKTAGLARIRRA
jgi:hypothetical protein